MRRFGAPVAASALFILWAPFIGEVRDTLRRAAPALFVPIVGGGVALLILALLAAALLRIRTARRARCSAIATALAGFAVWVSALRTGRGEVDAVELVHFLEYGLLGTLFYRAVREGAGDQTDPSALAIPLLCGTLAGTLEEWVQWLVPTRVGEARDVALNLYAVACGLLFGLGLLPPAAWRWRLSPRGRRAVCRLAAAVLVVFAAFFDCAHLGNEIRDPEIGRFRSYFTAAELLALQQVRAEEWRAHPPRRLEPLSKEDYYLTEGGWHAQVRNDAYAARAFDAAWRENRILEKYFAPFLDLRSFASGQPHRWPPAQRAEVEAGRAAASVSEYVSPAGLARVYIRPARSVLWTSALIAAAALLLLGGVQLPPTRWSTGRPLPPPRGADYNRRV